MFVDHEVVLGVGFPLARASLRRFAADGLLSHASSEAYSDGLDGLLRVGPFGDVPVAAKLVRVLLLEPVEKDARMTLPMRWEATGVMGRLFPVLDANLTLTQIDEESTCLALHGAYRPPMAGIGESLDRMLLHRAATATVRSLVKRISATIEVSARAPGWQTVADPRPEAGREARSLDGQVAWDAAGEDGVRPVWRAGPGRSGVGGSGQPGLGFE